MKRIRKLFAWAILGVALGSLIASEDLISPLTSTGVKAFRRAFASEIESERKSVNSSYNAIGLLSLSGKWLDQSMHAWKQQAVPSGLRSLVTNAGYRDSMNEYLTALIQAVSLGWGYDQGLITGVKLNSKEFQAYQTALSTAGALVARDSEMATLDNLHAPHGQHKPECEAHLRAVNQLLHGKSGGGKFDFKGYTADKEKALIRILSPLALSDCYKPAIVSKLFHLRPIEFEKFAGQATRLTVGMGGDVREDAIFFLACFVPPAEWSDVVAQFLQFPQHIRDAEAGSLVFLLSHLAQDARADFVAQILKIFAHCDSDERKLAMVHHFKTIPPEALNHAGKFLLWYINCQKFVKLMNDNIGDDYVNENDDEVSCAAIAVEFSEAIEGDDWSDVMDSPDNLDEFWIYLNDVMGSIMGGLPAARLNGFLDRFYGFKELMIKDLQS